MWTKLEVGREGKGPVQVLSKANAPRYRRPEGITSYLLASPRTSQAKHLTTTLVQIEPGGEQRVHGHPPEQAYFILEGSGLMTVGTETQEVGPGDCIFIPSEAQHGIRNHGREVLRYFSAAAPAFDTIDLISLWPLGSESDEAGKQE
jgi:mannose-6-phosphate isomerase-like protein (cupin superfamily)